MRYRFGKEGAKMVMECEWDEHYKVWMCNNPMTGRVERFVPEEYYDTTLDILSNIGEGMEFGGTRDIDMVVNMLIQWRHNAPSRYDSIMDRFYDCMKEYKGIGGQGIGFYCLMRSIEEEAKDYILDEFRNKGASEEFLEWLEENLNETEMYYNYLDWGCASAPYEELCYVVEKTMRDAEIPEKELIGLIERLGL